MIKFEVPISKSQISTITLQHFILLVLYHGEKVILSLDKSVPHLLVAIPSKSISIEEDKKKSENIIDTDEKLRGYLESWFSDYYNARSLYLFDIAQGPSQSIAKNEGTIASKPSRDSTISRDIRAHANNSCQICGRKFPGGVGITSCHLFEMRSVPEDINNRVETYNELGLAGVNDSRNYLCLCKICQVHLDNYNITINPLDHDLIISPRIFDHEIYEVDGIAKYQDLVEDVQGNLTHRKLYHIDGDAYKHPQQLLQYRYRLYQIEQRWKIMSKQRSTFINFGGKRKSEFAENELMKKLKTQELVLNSTTCKQLKEFLSAAGIPRPKRKAELFEKVQNLQKFLNEGVGNFSLEELENNYGDEFEEALRKCKFRYYC